MTGNKENFLSLTDYQGRNGAFGNSKTREIIIIKKVDISMSYDIENTYYVLGLKHNLLSISQLFDKRNIMRFATTDCIVTNPINGRNTQGRKV